MVKNNIESPVLPIEVWLSVCNYIKSPIDLLSLSAVNRQLRCILKFSSSWKGVTQIDLSLKIVLENLHYHLRHSSHGFKHLSCLQLTEGFSHCERIPEIVSLLSANLLHIVVGSNVIPASTDFPFLHLWEAFGKCRQLRKLIFGFAKGLAI